ncbi:DUF4905 domain-containing protein [Mucilaginibacter boryungensis]|uniref:DUF4905 domain-containing protein n=1 Tax=Mucilaginibacter boryungensis TaxID=768480 RepID=A0ABR9XIR3_9SPHI|nr:DUF4905 domain-containing protein [Mucilaginibacter boryungensis]MBE9666969.1 DUF4905 domain-containing protein [Mucilaginibacter boryungensis]
MALSSYIKHQFNGIVWRMEIDPVNAMLFVEIRNEQEKQVSFASISLPDGQINFNQLYTDERWLTGIEAAYNNVLLLHNYESPGSPTHKGIIAIDGLSGKILWSDYNRTFNHLSKNGPVIFDNRIQPRKLFTVSIKRGETIGPYNPIIDEDIETAIILPDVVNADNLELHNLPEQPFGNIVHNLYHNDFRIVSLHALKSDQLNQVLYIFKNDRLVFNDLLNTGIQKLQPEAFVLHHHYLIYLKNKVELNVINLKTE